MERGNPHTAVNPAPLTCCHSSRHFGGVRPSLPAAYMRAVHAQHAGGLTLPLAVAALLGALSLAWRSDCLCSPTAFYHNCWIRRFPGLLLDLQESQRRGARVLRRYWESTAQQCGRTCCLLRNGVDPDLLVFERMSFKDLNPRSSFPKWERQNSSKTAECEKCQHAQLTSMTLSLQTSPLSPTGETDRSLNHDGSGTVQKMRLTTDSWQPSVPHSHVIEQTLVSSEGTKWTTSSVNPVPFSTLTSSDNKSLSQMPNLAHLNSSKQHLNETKGYSGRNQSTDSEHGGHKPVWIGASGKWLLPVVLCCSITFVCCCGLLLAVGHRRKRTGHYRPVKKVELGPRKFIKYSIIKGRL
ncbi:MANSC domain-containing protein 4 isoform X2 [Pleurodeles waltl]|uniref:MANSC domain-containing protein 4 isoform X2 n=1 Tax=Pleurodeles waltl TaxID=8319 RepID=UPI0037099B0F